MIAQSWLVSWISDDVNFLDDEFKKKPPFYLYCCSIATVSKI